MDPLTFDHENPHVRVDRGEFESARAVRVPRSDEPMLRVYFTDLAVLADRRVA
ncbi:MULTISPECIES: hypothetical protein [unclassified Streptomyces]|uniref:hypothetical protein n=1 Tax=unclassified Streptomyces TaxID=2593676 RepID=UPI0033F07BEB